MKFAADAATFVAERRPILERGDSELGPRVSMALVRYRRTPDAAWHSGVIEGMRSMWTEVYTEEQGEAPDDRAIEQREEFLDYVTETLGLTTEPAPTVSGRRDQEQRITRWLSTATVNDATNAVATFTDTDSPVFLEWVTMRDDDVRESHREVGGTTVPVGERFTLEGVEVPYPGAPIGPPELWLNCRCLLRPTLEGAEMSAPTKTFASTEEPPEVDIDDEEVDPDAPVIEEDDEDLMESVPFHGVLAPINVMSADRRRFKEQAITWRDGPAALPLRWVKSDVGAHQGAVRVANFERIWEEDNEIRVEGHMFVSAEADEVVGMLAEGPMGVSVDLDIMTASYLNEDGSDFDFELWEPGDTEPIMEVSEGRISAATLVDIPAFQEAYIALGEWPSGDEEEDSLEASGCTVCDEMDAVYADMQEYAITDAEWDGSASRFTDEEWVRSTVVDRGEDYETDKERYAVPIREPNGDLNRNAVHNAAARIDQVEGASEEALAEGKRALVAAYRQLEEDPPESLVASALPEYVTFVPGTRDGPGWITNPRDTQRLRDYWVRGAGAAKIRWNTPGDFTRCTRQLRKYIPNPAYLNGTCANLHRVATGMWPGDRRNNSANIPEGAVMASAFTIAKPEPLALTAAGTNLPASWFEDPGLDHPTPLTITDEGHIYGHVASWDICHIAQPAGADTCTLAPRSQTDYAYFKTGVVRTDAGETAVGHITMETGHAGGRLGASAAAAHYDNTGAVVADVNVGEDAHGIWFAGALRPGVDEEKVDALRAAGLSGDWRTIRGNYEMVAALAVNVPGFPIPRVSISASASGEQSLVASGIVWSRNESEAKQAAAVDPTAIAEAVLHLMDKRQRLTTVRSVMANEFGQERQERLAAAREKISL